MKTTAMIMMGCAGMVLAANSAEASMVQVRDAFGGETASGAFQGKFLVGTGNSLRGTADGGSAGTLATGTFDFEADFGVGFDELLTYCLEPLNPLDFGDAPGDSVGTKYDQAPLTALSLSTQDIEYIEILWANAFDTSTGGKAAAGAFQAFIWEVVVDGSDNFDVDAGDFDLLLTFSDTAAAAALATEWFENIDTGVWTDRAVLAALTSPASQNLLFEVPAPGTAVLAAAGLGVMGGRRRRNA